MRLCWALFTEGYFGHLCFVLIIAAAFVKTSKIHIFLVQRYIASKYGIVILFEANQMVFSADYFWKITLESHPRYFFQQKLCPITAQSCATPPGALREKKLLLPFLQHFICPYKCKWLAVTIFLWNFPMAFYVLTCWQEFVSFLGSQL